MSGSRAFSGGFWGFSVGVYRLSVSRFVGLQGYRSANAVEVYGIM